MTRKTISEGRYTANISKNGSGADASFYCVFMIGDHVARSLPGRSYSSMKTAERCARSAMKKAA